MSNVPPPVSQPYPPPPTKPGAPAWAIVLVVLCIFGTCGIAILAAILFPVFAQAKLAATRTACLSNVKQQAIAMAMYSDDNNDRFPKSGEWMDRVVPYIYNGASILRCPKVAKGQYGYAMNRAMSDKPVSKIADPARTILSYESTNTSRNAQGDGKTGIANRHGGKSCFAYADGHSSTKPVAQE